MAGLGFGRLNRFVTVIGPDVAPVRDLCAGLAASSDFAKVSFQASLSDRVWAFVLLVWVGHSRDIPVLEGVSVEKDLVKLFWEAYQTAHPNSPA